MATTTTTVPKQFEVLACPRCKSEDIYFQEVGSKPLFRCRKCGVLFRESKA